MAIRIRPNALSSVSPLGVLGALARDRPASWRAPTSEKARAKDARKAAKSAKRGSLIAGRSISDRCARGILSFSPWRARRLGERPSCVLASANFGTTSRERRSQSREGREEVSIQRQALSDRMLCHLFLPLAFLAPWRERTFFSPKGPPRALRGFRQSLNPRYNGPGRAANGRKRYCDRPREQAPGDSEVGQQEQYRCALRRSSQF
jgi:hypothetical protein